MSLIDLENRYFNGGHGGPWASSNDTQVRVLIDGEQYFRALNTAINSCTGEGDVIYLLNWSLISTFHLIPHGEAGSIEIGQQLAEKAARGVDVRSIIWIHQLFQNWVASRTPGRSVGEENLRSATAMRSLMVGAARPLQYRVLLDFTGARLGANHQKVVIIKAGSNLTAFVSGLDFNEDRWDTNQHPHSTDERPHGWHDAGIQVWGETARLVWQNFRIRWRECRTLPVRTYRGSRGAQEELNPRSRLLPPDPVSPPPPATASPTPHVSTQVLRNFSDIKLWNPVWSGSLNLSWMDLPSSGVHEVAATWERAIRAAQQYIYIEDQYGYAPLMLFPVLRAVLMAAPAVKVILLLPTGGPGSSVGANRPDPLVPDATLAESLTHFGPTVSLPAASIERIAIYRLNGIFVHSKVILIDDQFMSIGSANFADRSISPTPAGEDSELSVAVVDDAATTNVVRETRKRLWAEHFGLDLSLSSVSTQLDAPATSLPFWRANWDAAWHPGDPPNPAYRRPPDRLQWVGPGRAP